MSERDEQKSEREEQKALNLLVDFIEHRDRAENAWDSETLEMDDDRVERIAEKHGDRARDQKFVGGADKQRCR
jgi:hypothetical protein